MKQSSPYRTRPVLARLRWVAPSFPQDWGREGRGERGPAPGSDLLVLPLALVLDLILGEPPNALHPVVWIGAAIGVLEQWAPDAESQAGVGYGAAAALAISALTAAAALATERAAARLRPPLRVPLLAAVLKPAFALRMLLRAGRSVRRALVAGEIELAREHLRALVSRDVAELMQSECAAAAVESLAENLTDSFVGPWLGYALAGLGGAWFFRSVNTLDSRWGYRGRYEFLGRSGARLDDILAWVPARFSAILLIVAAPAGGGDPVSAWRVAFRDHGLTASPNAGWTMSAMAGALGRRLEKRGHYTLNAGGSDPGPDDIRRAERIVLAAAILGFAGMSGIEHAFWRRLRRRV